MSNSISFVGKLGKDSERKATQSGQMLKFSVAENVGWGERKTVNWWNCSLFGKQAEGTLMDYLTKGTQVFIVGEVSFSEYEGKTYNNVTIKHIELVGSRDTQQQNIAPKAPQYGQRPQGYAPKPNAGGGTSDLDDDLPFSYIDSRLG